MVQNVAALRALQDQIVFAVQTKIPKDYQEDARALIPSLDTVLQTAVADYRPPTAEALVQQLKGDPAKEAKLLVELLTEKDPLFFMAEVERNLFLRKKDMARRRQERRNIIEGAFNRAVRRVAGNLMHVNRSAAKVPLLDHLIKSIGVADVGYLGQQASLWHSGPIRETLKSEIDQHVYYFVVRLLDTLRSYEMPEKFKVRTQDLEPIRAAVLVVLHEVFATTVERLKTGRFVVRKTHYGNRGDRSMDREMFLTRRRRRGLGAVIEGIADVYAS